MSVSLDTIADASVRHDARGVQVIRTALLNNISATPDQVYRAALTAPGMPRYGDVHPAFPELRVVDIALTPIDSRQWRAAITYAEPRPEDRAQFVPVGTVVDVSWYSANVTIDRLYDANGNRMFHWYAGYPESPVINGGNVFLGRSSQRQVGVKAERADVQIPSVGARVMMAEATDPRNRIAFIGRVNAGWWSGNAPGTWLFVGVSGNLEQSRWINQYDLLYRADTWRLESVIEFNSAPPSDATVGNGIAFFDVYQSANFNQLGFSL